MNKKDMSWISKHVDFMHAINPKVVESRTGQDGALNIQATVICQDVVIQLNNGEAFTLHGVVPSKRPSPQHKAIIAMAKALAECTGNKPRRLKRGKSKTGTKQ